MRRPKIGDIVEIRTSKGLVYAQFTHRVPLYGSLLRVLEGFWPERPVRIEGLASRQTRFHAFFPVEAAVARGLVDIAGSAPLPESVRTFPRLRQRGQILPNGRVDDWRLWDGNCKWRVETLTPEQRKLSIAEIVNDTLLIERLESDWRPNLVT